MRAINRNYYLILLGLSDKYQWVEDPKPFDDAREFCQSLGDGWDMAIIMNRLQLDLLTDLGNQWIGLERNGQETKTIFNKPTFWAGMKYDKKETFSKNCISLNAENRRIVTKNCETAQEGFEPIKLAWLQTHVGKILKDFGNSTAESNRFRSSESEKSFRFERAVDF